MTRSRQALLATLIALVLVAIGLYALPAGASVDTQAQTARDNLANCQLLAAHSTGAQRDRARACVTDQTRILQLLGATPSPTATASPTGSSPGTSAPPTTTQPPPTTAPPTTAPPTTPPPTTPPPGGWPGADNTGVPAGVTLTPWTGGCKDGVTVITMPNLVIDSWVFNCNVSVRAAGVVITRSRINGWIDNTDQAGSYSLTDSEVALPGVVQLTAVGNHDFTLLRTDITGGNRGVYCARTCDIRDSWIHGTKIKDNWHASAVRMEQGLTLVHNTLVCDAPVQPNPEGSCSASLTGYGDFAPVRDNLIQGNYFPATQYAAYCAYGGSSKGKPFSNDTANIRFIDNVFERGTLSTNHDCALYGAVGDWDPTRPGAVFTGNKYSDGTPVPNVQT